MRTRTTIYLINHSIRASISDAFFIPFENMLRELNKLCAHLGVEPRFYNASGYYDGAIYTCYGAIQVFQEYTKEELTGEMLGWLQNNIEYVKLSSELHKMLCEKDFTYLIIPYTRKDFSGKYAYCEVYKTGSVLRRIGADKLILESDKNILISETIKTLETL